MTFIKVSCTEHSSRSTLIESSVTAALTGLRKYMFTVIVNIGDCF
jgi:hypothetical protein